MLHFLVTRPTSLTDLKCKTLVLIEQSAKLKSPTRRKACWAYIHY